MTTAKTQSKTKTLMDDQLKAQIVNFGKEATKAFVSGLFFSLGHLVVTKMSSPKQDLSLSNDEVIDDNVVNLKIA